MEDRSHALIAILFIVVFAVGAVAVAWWMITPGAVRVPYLLESKISVAGLGEGSAVQYKGVKIGVVKKIHLDRETHRTIQVSIAIDKDFPLPGGSYATVGSSGLIGPKLIKIHLGKGPGTIRTSAGHPAKLPLKEAGLAALMDQAQAIVSEVKQTLDSVQGLFSKQNVEQIGETLDNIHQASAQLVAIEQAIAPAAKKLPALVTAALARVREARQLIAHADRLVVEARAPLSAVGDAASSSASLMAELDQETVPQLNATLARLSSLSARLEALATELSRYPQSLILGAPKHPGPGESGAGK